MESQRVLVTGGAGFVGSHLCDALATRGHEVVCVDNLITGNRQNLARVDDNGRFTFVHHDLSKPLYLEGRVDAVYHLASPASPKDYLDHPIQTLKVGALGTYHMLGLAKAHGARLLLASTSEVYGDPLVNPQPETYWGHVNPIGPRGVYDEAKRYAEAITMAYHRYHGVDTRIARIFNTYGPRMRPNDGRAIPTFIMQALSGRPITVYGDGSQTRSFCYIDDLILGLQLLMVRGAADPVNLGNPEEITILELAQRVQKTTGCDSDIVFEPLPLDDPRQRRPDITRARNLFGWTPRVTLQAGLMSTVRHFEALLAAGRQ